MGFYMIMDQMTVWGAGKTLKDARDEACTWLVGDNNDQGISEDELDKMIIYEHESKNGQNGVFIYEVDDCWDDRYEGFDGDQLYEFYWAQEDAQYNR